MGVLSKAINGLNGGKGVKMLTEKGSKVYEDIIRIEKKRRNIHPSTDVTCEKWANDIKDGLFQEQYEGIYWNYGKYISNS